MVVSIVVMLAAIFIAAVTAGLFLTLEPGLKGLLDGK